MYVEQLVEQLTPRIQAPWGEPLREWRERHAGGQVIGCFPVYCPVELIHAAGFLPLGLFGAGTEVEMLHADARFVSFVCSIAKSTLELGFQQRLQDVDGLFFHSICDVARNLSSVFERNFPQLWVEYIHLPQNPTSSLAIDYYTAELTRLRRKLEERKGGPVSDEQLRASIRIYNAARHLVASLYALRERDPDRLRARDLNVLTRAFTCQDPATTIVQLQMALQALSSRNGPPRDRVRVLVEGAFCEQPPLQLVETLEEAGCAVVEDDFVRGWRWFTQPVSTDGDPLRNMAESYLRHSWPSSVRHDWKDRRDLALPQRVRRCGAQAVVFCIPKFCEPALFDYVPYKDELEKAGIPHLMVEYEEKMWTFERLRNEVETFVESILFD